MSLQFIIFLLLLGFVHCNESGKILIRLKRWGKSGNMNNNGNTNNNGNMNNNGDLSNMFRGTAGVDYPDFHTIPTTNFHCDDQVYEGGLYADVETQCQVYHVCHEGRKDSFLCGKGTVFNQEILACDYWYSTDCSKAPSFYYVNAQIGGNGGNAGAAWVPQPGNSGQEPSNNFGTSNYKSDNSAAVPVHGNSGQEPSNTFGSPNYGSDNNANFPAVPLHGNSGQEPSNTFGSSNYGSDNNANFPAQDNFNNEKNPSNSFGDTYYTQNNPSALSRENNGRNSATGAGSNYNDPQNPNQEDCCCQKYSYKTPWNFPSGQINSG